MSACKHRTSKLAISSGCPLKTQGICHHSFCVFATAGEELLTFKAFPPFQLATAAWAVRDGLQRNTKTFNFFLRGDGLRHTTTNLEKWKFKTFSLSELMTAGDFRDTKKLATWKSETGLFLFPACDSTRLAARGGLQRKRQINPKKLQKHCKTLLQRGAAWWGFSDLETWKYLWRPSPFWLVTAMGCKRRTWKKVNKWYCGKIKMVTSNP